MRSIKMNDCLTSYHRVVFTDLPNNLKYLKLFKILVYLKFDIWN